MARDGAGDVVVQEARHVRGVLRLGPVAEHHRHGAEDLHIDMVLAAILQSSFWAPTVVFDLTKELLGAHHARTAGFMVLEADPFTVPIALMKVGPCFRQNMRVQIDFHALGTWCVAPQFLQRCSSVLA